MVMKAGETLAVRQEKMPQAIIVCM
jgi:hypothetical protein